jgi:hypothetical protein
LKIQGVAQTENNIKQNLKKKMKNLGFFSSFILFFKKNNNNNFLFFYNFMKSIFVIGGTLTMFGSLGGTLTQLVI